jgi:hypothetical protein
MLLNFKFKWIDANRQAEGLFSARRLNDEHPREGNQDQSDDENSADHKPDFSYISWERR